MTEVPAPQSVRGPAAVSRPAADRISSLDLIRGVAILGIIPRHALEWAEAGGAGRFVDALTESLTVLLVDKKMMGLFSLLFGVGVVVFYDRARAARGRVVGLTLWRFLLLFAIGAAHYAFWDGDVLTLYALCSPIVLGLHRLPTWALGALGLLVALPDFLIADVEHLEPGRALGFMLFGVALYRLGIVQGQRDVRFYQRLAGWGLASGAAVTTAGLLYRILTGWTADSVAVGHIATGLGVIPMTLGYMALLILWNRSASIHLERFRNTGRMALTNFLAQTALGLITLGWLLDDLDVNSVMVGVWVLCVWALQLWWSTWWLSRFRYGPVEWIWRSATYRRRQPLRKANSSCR